MQASRNGYFFVLDRTNGKNLLTTPFATVNWAKGIDEEGRPIPEPATRNRRATAAWSRPNEGGGTNYRSPSFDPTTGLFIVSAQDAYGIYFFKPEHGDYGLGGRRLRRLQQGRRCGRSITRPARSAGTTTSAAEAAPGC